MQKSFIFWKARKKRKEKDATEEFQKSDSMKERNVLKNQNGEVEANKHNVMWLTL